MKRRVENIDKNAAEINKSIGEISEELSHAEIKR